MTTPDQQIAALKRERAGYVNRGLDERVTQVDEEIARLQAEDAASDEAPEGRSGPESQQQTADTAGQQQTGNVGPGTGNGEAKVPAKKTAAKKTAAPPQK